MSALEFGIKITAINAASSVLRGVRDNIRAIANSNKEVKKSYDDTVKSMRNAAIAAVATGAAIKGIGKGVSQSANVAEAVSKARAELLRANKPAQELNAELRRIRESATQIQAVTVFDTKQIVEAQVMLLRAGKTLEEVTDTSNGLAVTISQVATLMEDTPENVATGFLKVSDTFLDAEHSARNLADTITKAAGTANSNFTDMATVIGRAGGFAKEAGVSFDDMVAGAALAFNKFAGQPERLSTAMQEFFSRAKDVDSLIEDGALVSMPEIVKRLNERLDGMTSQQRLQEIERMFGKSSFLSLFITTLLSQGEEGFKSYNEQIQKMAGLQDKVNAVMGNSKKQSDAARGSLGSLVAEVFKDLETVLGGVVTRFNELLARISKFVSQRPAISKTVTAISTAAVGLGAAATAFFGGRAIFSGTKFLKGVGGIRGLFAKQVGLGVGLAKGKALQQAGVTPVYVVNANEIGGLGGVGTRGVPGSPFVIAGGLKTSVGALAAGGISGIATISAAVIGSATVGLAIGSLINTIIKDTAVDKWLQKGADKVYDFFFETGEERVRRKQQEATATRSARARTEAQAETIAGRSSVGFGTFTEAAQGDRLTGVIVNNYIDGSKATPEKVLVEQTKDFNIGAADALFIGSDKD